MLFAAGAQQVTLFADCSFRGYSVSLGPGNYISSQHRFPLRELSSINIPPGTISSIKIPPGIKVTVYEGFNFDGDYRILTYSIDNFAAEGQGRWNKKIHSLVVEPNR